MRLGCAVALAIGISACGILEDDPAPTVVTVTAPMPEQTCQVEPDLAGCPLERAASARIAVESHGGCADAWLACTVEVRKLRARERVIADQ